LRSLWHEIRNYRISASVKAHKIKSCKNLLVEYQNNLAISLLNEKVLGYQGKINVAFGKKYEEEAVGSYSKLFGTTILKCGIVIHAQKPWLCGSPYCNRKQSKCKSFRNKMPYIVQV